MGYSYGYGYGHTWKPDKRITASTAGGGGLLLGEKNGWATDFLYPDDSKRVALNTGGSTKFFDTSFFTQSGTSPKMVYDVAGTLGWSPHNQARQSQGFNTASWALEGATVTVAATTAPDGTLTGQKLVSTAGASVGNFVATTYNDSTGINAGDIYTWSIYAKAAEVSWLGIAGHQLNGSVDQSYFNLATGALGTKAATHLSSVITPAGNGWYRCSISYVTSGSFYLGKYHSHGANNEQGWSGSVGQGIYIWGAQVNKGSVPTAYLPTTTAARVGLALDYDPVTHAAKGLLVEAAATNLLQGSNDLATMTAEGGAATLNNQTGPDGALTADTYTEDTSNFVHASYGLTAATANTDYTLSRFIKMGTRRYATLGLSDGTNGLYGVYDLQSGVVGSSAAFGTGVKTSASIQALPNGWYRCILTGKLPVTTTYYTCGAATAATITPDAYGRQVFVGTGATLFFGHNQLELGTVATSPIPTLGAQVTRAADNVTVTPAQINHSATAGSWWVDMEAIAPPASVARIIGYTTSSATPLYTQGNTNPMFFGLFDGAGNILKSAASTYGRHRLAAAFQNADRAMTFDGLAASTDTAAGIAFGSPGALIGIGGDPITTQSMWMRQVRYLPRRQTNTELQVSTILPGGASMLGGETNGLGIDFTWPTNTERVAIATAGILSQSTVNGFMQNAGTSPKTIYDVTGRLGWAPHNLILQSSTFDNGSWGKNNAAISANAITSPFGAIEADAFIPNAPGGSPFVNQLVTVNNNSTVTFSLYVKYGALAAPWLLVRVADSTTFDAYFNLATGLKGTTVGPVISSNIVAVGGGWYRCDMTYVTVATSTMVYISMSPSDGGGSGNSVGNGTAIAFYLWGSQYNYGLVPTVHIPTLTSTKVGVGEDYDPVTHAGKGVLVEPAATNLLPRSSELDDAGTWAPTNITVVANQAVAPDGTTTMDKIYPTSSGGNRWINPAVVGSAVTHTLSIFAKSAGLRWLYFLKFDGSDFAAWFDLQNGVVGNVAAGYTSAIQSVGNGVYRCSMTGLGQVAFNAIFGVSDANGGSTVTASGTNGVYLWGAQAEAGTVVTSYIPTTSATVTRAADNISFLLSTMPAFSTEFTLYSRWQTSNTNSGRFAWSVNDNQGAPNDFAGFFAQTALGRLQIGDQTASQASIAAGALVANTTVAMAGRIKANNFAASMNGAAVVTDTVGTQPTVTHCRFGNTGGSSSASAQFYVEKMAIICRGLTDAELVTKAAT